MHRTMKYSGIKDINDLHSARKQLGAEILAKGEEVKELWYKTKEAYSPASLLAAGIKSISGRVPVDKIVLWILRLILRR